MRCGVFLGIAYLGIVVASVGQTRIDNLATTDTFINISSPGDVCASTYVYDVNQQFLACCSSLVTAGGLSYLSARNDLLSNILQPTVPTSILVKIAASTPIGRTCDAASPGATVSLATTTLGPSPGIHTSLVPQVIPTAQDKAACQSAKVNGGGLGICNTAHVLFGDPNVPLLGISKTHTGAFIQGQTGKTYTVVVSNNVFASPTIGPVTVTETIPSGLTLVSLSGAGWTCSGLSCTRSDVLAPGASYPAITVTVNVAAQAASPQVNSVTVSGGGSANATAADATVITPDSASSSIATEIDNLNTIDTFVNLSTTGNVCANSYVLNTSQQLIACCSSLIDASRPFYLSGQNDLISNSITAAPSSILLKVFGSAPNAGNCNASAPGAAVNSLTASLASSPGIAGTPLAQAVPTALDLQICQSFQGNGSKGICGQARVISNGPSIVLPIGLSVNPGEQTVFTVGLSAPAPYGGVFVALTLSNPALASLTTATVLIPEGQTTSSRVRLNGLAVGTETVTATASGYPTNSTRVQIGSGVTAQGPSGTPSSLILPTNVVVNAGGQVVVPVSLSGPAPASGVFINLSVSNPAIAFLNTPSVFIASGETQSIRLRVNGVSPGTVTLTATAPGYANVSQSVQVQ